MNLLKSVVRPVPTSPGSTPPPKGPQPNLSSIRFAAGWFLVCLAWLSTACRPTPPPDDGLQLLLGTVELRSDTTFELRAPWNIAPQTGDKAAALESPLEFDPPLAGQFEWKSRRSGIYTPMEPLALGREYTIRLKRGLKDAQGNPLAPRLLRRLETPGLTVTEFESNYWNHNDLPATPLYTVWFNALVAPEQLQRRARFINRALRESVHVVVEPSTNPPTLIPNPQALPSRAPSRMTWREQFGLLRKSQRAAIETQESTPPPPGANNEFQLRPEHPLPAGDAWELVFEKGLKSIDSSVSMAETYTQRLGTVRSFELESIEPTSTPMEGRVLQLRFTKHVLSTPNLDALTNWIQIEPAPTNLSYRSSWKTVQLHGDFQLGTAYTLRIRPALPSEDGQQLPGGIHTNIEFAPMSPNIWFPAFDITQLKSGRRTFPLHFVNSPKFRVRAKLLDEHTLIHTLRGYDRYFNRGGIGGWIDFNGVAGRTIFETNLISEPNIDAPGSTVLSWDDILGHGRGGAIFIDASNGNAANPTWSPLHWTNGPQSIIQVSDLGLLWKLNGNQIQAWTFSHHTGSSLQGVRVRLVGNENEFLSDALSDRDGIARLPMATNAVWILAQKDEDLHAVSLDENRLWPWGLGVADYDWNSGSETDTPQEKSFLFTDRSLYRPGESIHVKGYVRAWRESQWQLSQAREAQLEFQDPRGESVLKTNVAINALGSWSFDLPAPLRPRGLYELTARIAGTESRQSVRVSDFRPAPFEIAANTQTAYHFTNTVQIPISARFLHGDPVEGARMNWNLSGYPFAFAPDGFESYSFDGEPEEESAPDAEPRLTGDFISAHGADVALNPTNTVIELQRPSTGFTSNPYRGTLTIDVTDANDHTVSKNANFVIHPSEFYLGFKWSDGAEAVLAPNVPLTFDVVAVSRDTSPIPQTLGMHAVLRRVEWKTARVRSAGGAIEYQNHSEVTDVQSLDFTLQIGPNQAIAVHNPTQPFASSRATFDAVKTPGSYRLDLATQDATGRPVRRSVSFDVSGDATIAWNFRNGARLQLTPDRSRYKQGDTAAILVKAPFSGTAWVTSEREGIQSSYITNLTGSAPLVYVPISSKDAPNVFVSVALVRGTAASTREHPMPEWRIGYCSLSVTAPENELQVSVKTDAPSTRPGAMVRTTVHVTGRASGSSSTELPVANAEVTLFAVDEGVLALTGDTVPDPQAFYSKPRPLALSTGVSLKQLLTEDPSLMTFHNKGAVGGGGGKEGMLGHMRQDFRLCAFWAPNLMTDAQGNVQAEFPMPDSLTRFRICAVVTAGSARFGSAATTIQVDKPLMLQPAGIDFAHVGDRFHARALLFNRSSKDADVEVSLRLDSKAAHSPLGIPSTLPQRQQTVRVPANSSSRVSFEVALTDVGESQWEWKAAGNAGDSANASDAVQSRIQIREARPVEREVFFVETHAAETNLVWLLNPRLLEGDATLRLHVGNSPLLQLGESIEQLLHYPYGCVEQTSSSLLPWVLFSKTQGLFPGFQTNANRIQSAIQEGFARLWAMQTASGGLSYWPGGNEPMYWGTAYAALVLNIAHEQDIPVPQNRRASILTYLAQKLATDPLSDPTASCLALYALQRGGESVPGALERLADSISLLSPEDRWMLALTAAAQQSPRLPEILKPTPLPKGGSQPSTPLFGSKEREAALNLLYQSQLSTDSEATQRAIDKLLGTRRHGHWGTTQGNAWALFALYSATPASATGTPFNGSMLVGSVRRPFQFEGSPEVITADFELPRTGNTSPTGILLQNPSRQRLFIHGVLTSKPTGAFKASSAEAQGIAIDRRYERLTAENKPSPSTPWKPGDRIRVTLRITAEESREWIAIEDPLPACFEVASRRARAPVNPGPGIQPWQGDFEEVRGDSIRFFRNLLPEGIHEVEYIARVRATGEIVAPAARVEAMYEPQVHGRSAAAVLKIEP